MNKHKSSKIKENSNTVRHLIIGQIITTQNLVATKVVRLAGQSVARIIVSLITPDDKPEVHTLVHRAKSLFAGLDIT